MLLVFLTKIVFLLVIMGAQIRRPHLLFRLAKFAFWLAAFFAFFAAGYLTYEQYQIWKVSGIAQLLLPPHQPIRYFIQYAITHFWTASMIAFAAALLALVAAKLLNRKFQERFFFPDEPWLFATGILLAGHPGWIFYVIVVCAAFLLFSILSSIVSGRRERLTLYYFWLPAAIATIISTWFKFPFSS